MAKQTWRDEFMAAMGAAGVRVVSARRLMMLARRAKRLAEAACNGDYPADNGERAVELCGLCWGGWVATSFRSSMAPGHDAKVCPDCRCEQEIHLLVAADWPEGWRVVCAGDPRGAAVSLVRPGAVAEHGYYQHRDLVAVPS